VRETLGRLRGYHKYVDAINMFKITNLITIAFIFFLLIASYLLLLPPTRVIDKQLAAVRAGDIAIAYSYTSDAFQKTNSLLTFKTFIREVPVFFESQGITINEETIDPEQRNALIVKGFFRGNENKQIPFEYTLVRSHNLMEILKGWKIQTIKVQYNETWKILTADSSFQATYIPQDLMPIPNHSQ